MISDVLFEAVEKIESYQHTFPQVYDNLEKDINLVVAAMDWLRHRLDQCGTETNAAIMCEEGGHGLGKLDQQLPDDHRNAGQSGAPGATIEERAATVSDGDNNTHHGA